MRRSPAPPWRVALIAAALAVFCAMAATAGENALEVPLVESDIVRMITAGTPEEEILKTIAERRVAFDLSEEMIAELRNAGVSGRVVEAMIVRQRALTPKPEIPEELGPAPGFALVRVQLASAESEAGRSLYVPAAAWEGLAETLQLGPRADDRRVHDLAVFFACRTRDHVPGLWRTASPLGRDFVSIPPHLMLAFQTGAHPVRDEEVPPEIRKSMDQRDGKATPSPEWLRLDLPAELSAEMETSPHHDLILGVAALIGDHYLVLGMGRAKDAIVGADTKLKGSIRAGGARGDLFEVSLEIPR